MMWRSIANTAALLVLVVGPGCLFSTSETESGHCEQDFAGVGAPAYEELEPARRMAALDGTWVTELQYEASGEGDTLIAVALVAGEPPRTITSCPQGLVFDAPFTLYAWTEDGALDTAFSGEVRIWETSVEDIPCLAIPSEDLGGALLTGVEETGSRAELCLSLDTSSGHPVAGSVRDSNSSRIFARAESFRHVE